MEGFMDISDQIKKLHEQVYKIEVEVLEGGKMPTKAHPTDAGFDVYATEDVVISHGAVTKHPLNIRMKLPAGSWARIETKSGLGSKGVLVYAGVVDEAYRGIPHVIATHLVPGGEVVVKKGEKLAQITMNNHSNSYYMEQVESVDTKSDRGEGGFGSSGK
jgi:dUTP pyrophosphatase